MSKQKHNRQKQTAVRDTMLKEYEKQLSQMSDEDFLNLSMAIPPENPMVPAVWAEHQKRHQKRMQEFMDTAPSPELKKLAEDIFSTETFDRFLQENGENEGFKRLCEGNEEVFGQLVSGHSEKTGRMN